MLILVANIYTANFEKRKEFLWKIKIRHKVKRRFSA